MSFHVFLSERYTFSTSFCMFLRLREGFESDFQQFSQDFRTTYNLKDVTETLLTRYSRLAVLMLRLLSPLLLCCSSWFSRSCSCSACCSRCSGFACRAGRSRALKDVTETLLPESAGERAQRASKAPTRSSRLAVLRLGLLSSLLQGAYVSPVSCEDNRKHTHMSIQVCVRRFWPLLPRLQCSQL